MIIYLQINQKVNISYLFIFSFIAITILDLVLVLCDTYGTWFILVNLFETSSLF